MNNVVHAVHLSRYLRRLCTRHLVSGFTAAAATMLFIVLFSMQAGKPLNLDNMDFPAVAAATATTGLPVYYRGEDASQWLGLYHPPLYIYALAGWFRTVGAGAVTARLFNLPLALLAGVVALQVFRNLFGRDAAWRTAPVFFVLYLLNPFALQGFSILDIDTSIYPLLIGLSVWVAVRFVLRDGEPRTTAISVHEHCILGLLVLLCLWSKLTTAIALPLVVWPVLSLRYGIVKAALYCAVLFVTSIVAFCLTYALYGQVTGLDIGYTWRFLGATLASKAPMSPTSQSVVSFYLTRLKDNLNALWCWGLLPALTGSAVAGLVAVWHAARAIAHQRRVWLGALSVLSFGLFIVVAYCLITRPFGGAPFKYIVPAWPIIALAYAALVTSLIRKSDGTDTRFILTASLAAAAALLGGSFFVQDRALLSGQVHPWSTLDFGAVVFLVAYLPLNAGRIWHTSRVALRQAGLVLVITFAAEYLGIGVYQTRAEHATQYDYGETGFIELCQWIDAHTASDEVIVSMKDVGFATGRRYIESYGYLYATGTVPQFEARVSQLGVRIFVFTNRHGQDQLVVNPGLRDWIERNTHHELDVGDYSVYVRNP